MDIRSVTIPLMTFLLALLLPLIAIPMIIIFVCYRQILRIVLKIMYWNRFCGLMEGGDVIWAVEDISKSIINILLVVNSNKSSNDFIQTVRRIILQKCFKDHSKLCCVRRKMFGYNFYLKQQYRLEDYVKVINVQGVLNKQYMENFISFCYTSDMPQEDSALCEFFIFDKPAEWSNQDISESHKNQFLILFRFHHCLGDGFSLIDDLVKKFSERDIKQQTDLWKKMTPRINWFHYLWIFFYGPASVIIQYVFRSVDRNILHGQKLSGQKIVVWATEKDEQMVPFVKMIKNKRLGTHFSDVILTAIAASMRNFYTKRDEPVPEFLTCVIPKPIIFHKETQKPNNRFSVVLLDLPLGSNDDLKTLEAVKAKTLALRDSPKFLVNYWLLTITSAVFPEPIIKPFIYSAHSTMVVSIMPGTSKLTIFEKENLQDAVFWIPHRGSTGVGFSVLTYDNRLQIGMTVDKALLVDKNDAQDIVHDIFKNIVKLYNHIYV